MRKITQKMLDHYLATKPMKDGNTEIHVNEFDARGTITQIYLHGNLIAEFNDTGLNIQNCGWFTNVTKERLNALPNVNIYQKNGKWFLNGKEWSGEFININNQ
jgi:hypothetical protein